MVWLWSVTVICSAVNIARICWGVFLKEPNNVVVKQRVSVPLKFTIVDKDGDDNDNDNDDDDHNDHDDSDDDGHDDEERLKYYILDYWHLFYCAISCK